LTGVVVPSPPGPVPESLRELLDVLDEEPVCPPDLLDLAGRVAERFFASTGEVLKSALPAKLPASGAVRYRITERGAFAAAGADSLEKAILEALSGGEAGRVRDLPGEGAGRQAAVRALEERGWIRPASGARDRARRKEIAYDLGPVRGADAERALGRSRKGREVVAFLVSAGRPATGAEIREATNAGGAVLRALVAKGLLRSF